MQAEFPLDPDLVYLNHAAVGVWPRRTRDAVATFAGQNMVRGAADYPEWLKVERSLRRRLQWLVNAESTDDIALLKNTSEGLSLVAYGLDWQAGDNIVISNREFPSNRIVWESLAGRGVELRVADIDGPDPEGAMLDLIDGRTRLLAVSSVQYGDGLCMDLVRLGEACRAQGIFFCVDAIQSLGALAFDALACHADAVVADAHKWLLGPEGIAVFYISPRWREKLKLHQFGWHMVEHAGDFDRHDWQPASSARRFEPGSPNMLGIHAFEASLSLLQELGMAHVESELLARTRRLMEMVHAHPKLKLISRDTEERCSGIVTFRVQGLDHAGHATLYRELMKAEVICAHRAGGIRFAPHFYTDPALFDAAFERLDTLLAQQDV